MIGAGMAGVFVDAGARLLMSAWRPFRFVRQRLRRLRKAWTGCITH